MDRQKLVNVYVNLIMSLHAELTDENDKVRLVIKELKLKQMLGLKTRGRFLDETKGFEGDFKVLPSKQSQKKVVSFSTSLISFPFMYSYNSLSMNKKT
jgi:hypothetical protein